MSTKIFEGQQSFRVGNVCFGGGMKACLQRRNQSSPFLYFATMF